MEDEYGKDIRKTDEGTLPGDRIFIVEDSQVKFMDRLLLGRDRKERTLDCLLGPGVRNVAYRFYTSYDRRKRGNNTSRVKSEELLKRFRELLGRIRDWVSTAGM